MAKLFPTVAELKLQVGMEWKRLRMLKKKQAGKLKLRKGASRGGIGAGGRSEVERMEEFLDCSSSGGWDLEKRVVNHALKWFNRSEMKYAAW